MIHRWKPLLCVALTAVLPALAQQGEAPATIARLKAVHGNVLVSKSSGLAAGTEDLRLAEGTRVITTNASDVTVAYDDGCEVHLKPNERFQVDKGRACAVLVAQPESILATPAGATLTATATGLTVYGVLLPSLAVGGVADLARRRSERNVSPS